MTTAESADTLFGGHGTCLLEDDDAQCGHIFFSEATRLLKFYCTFCREAYDDINYFCEHLSEHINAELPPPHEKQNFDHGAVQIAEEEAKELTAKSANTLQELAGANDDSELELYKTDEDDNEDLEVIEEEGAEAFDDAILLEEYENFQDQSMIVEELDEAAEIAAEVEAEMRQQQETLESVKTTDEFLEYPVESPVAEEATEHIDVDNATSVIKTSLQDTTIIDSAKLATVAAAAQRSLKKKRVTTVKVIAVKNRITELYQRIKFEEEKRLRGGDSNVPVTANISDEQQLTSPLQLPETPPETTTDDSNEEVTGTSNKLPETKTIATPPIRKIIGETVITLLPAGVTTGASSFSSAASATAAHNNGSSTSDKDCVCPACGKRFRSAFSLTIHKRTHYLESDNNIKLAHKCPDCDRLFNRISELKQHVEAVHYPQGFICPVCQRRLNSLTLLETHMRKVHLARPFNCRTCSKNFNTREAFEAHANVHLAAVVIADANVNVNANATDITTDVPVIDQVEVRCRLCGRKYPTETALQYHMRNHKAQEPQCCVVCGRMTLRITQHMKLHTPRPKRILSCSFCGKTFNFSSGLSHHLKVMHKNPRPPPKIRLSNPAAPKRKRKPRPSRSRKKSLAAKAAESVETTNELQKQPAENFNDKGEAEDPKRVIVEFIQNTTYSVADLDVDSQLFDNAPPIAREETITAVNSIVNDC